MIPPEKFQPTHVYVGNWLKLRKHSKCQLLVTWERKAPHNVLVLFEDGIKQIVPGRTLRKINKGPGSGG